MSYLDLIRDLRTGAPDPAKAARGMKVLGWICVFGAVWNYLLPTLMPVDEIPFRFPPDFPAQVLAVFLVLGMFFFLSAKGITNRELWGKRLGQAAVVLLVLSILGFLAMLIGNRDFPFGSFPRPFLIVFSAVFIAQIVVPAWFGIRYLGRLPVQDDGPASLRSRPAAYTAGSVAENRDAASIVRYKDALVPFGVPGTFALMLAIPIVGMLVHIKNAGEAAAGGFFFIFFLLIFVGPILYNRAASPFEQGRICVGTYTGGGSIFLFNGSWPFFRLLVYDDGVELRFMFHRFFIPYDRLEDLPEKIGFFSFGIRFRSDLPDVPSSIRFHGSSSKDILAIVRERRDRFLAARSGMAP